MSEVDDGGSVFSVPRTDPDMYGRKLCSPGMSLRDAFALAALAAAPGSVARGAGFVDRVAEWSYRVADAMLKARKTEDADQAVGVRAVGGPKEA